MSRCMKEEINCKVKDYNRLTLPPFIRGQTLFLLLKRDTNASDYQQKVLNFIDNYINHWFETRREITNFERPWYSVTTAPQIWSNTVDMGCAIVNYSMYMQMVCVYGGDVHGYPGFEVGKMGSKCENGKPNEIEYTGLCRSSAVNRSSAMNRSINIFIIILMVNLIIAKIFLVFTPKI